MARGKTGKVEILTGESVLDDNCMITYSEKAYDIGSIRVTLEQDMRMFDVGKESWDGRSPTELTGLDAKKTVERICPDIGCFEVSFILYFGESRAGSLATWRTGFSRRRGRGRS